MFATQAVRNFANTMLKRCRQVKLQQSDPISQTHNCCSKDVDFQFKFIFNTSKSFRNNQIYLSARFSWFRQCRDVTVKLSWDRQRKHITSQNPNQCCKSISNWLKVDLVACEIVSIKVFNRLPSGSIIRQCCRVLRARDWLWKSCSITTTTNSKVLFDPIIYASI